MDCGICRIVLIHRGASSAIMPTRVSRQCKFCVGGCWRPKMSRTCGHANQGSVSWEGVACCLKSPSYASAGSLYASSPVFLMRGRVDHICMHLGSSESRLHREQRRWCECAGWPSRHGLCWRHTMFHQRHIPRCQLWDGFNVSADAGQWAALCVCSVSDCTII